MDSFSFGSNSCITAGGRRPLGSTVKSMSSLGENEVPLMICVERGETIIPETPMATLVEIEEEGRSTPQIVGGRVEVCGFGEEGGVGIGHQRGGGLGGL